MIAEKERLKMTVLARPISQVVKFAYLKYAEARLKNKHSAKCALCRKVIKEKVGVSSSFAR